jgi:hypothetical protein
MKLNCSDLSCSGVGHSVVAESDRALPCDSYTYTRAKQRISGLLVYSCCRDETKDEESELRKGRERSGRKDEF